MMLTTVALLTILILPPGDEPEELHELLPGIRVTEGVIEFDGTISIDAHHPDTPDVYLEMFITAPDSREHESLVVSNIKASNLHAGLLAAGFDSGAPITRNDLDEVVPAHGDPLFITVAIQDDAPEFVPITDWVMHVDAESELIENEKWGGFVFAGSKFTKRGYEADGTGTLVSLTSFGDEVIAPVWTISHLAEIDEPAWIANRDRVPERNTKVVVRIQREESHEPDGIDIDRNP